MAGHETSRPATQIYLRGRTAGRGLNDAPEPKSGRYRALQRPYSPSWSTYGYADLTTAGTATTSAFGPDIGVIRRSA